MTGYQVPTDQQPWWPRWLALAAVIAAEVVSTLALRAALDHHAWVAVAVVGYLAVFVGLGIVLRLGITIAVAYSIWGGAGTALTAILSAVLFGESLHARGCAGIALIITGIVLIERGARPELSGDSGSGGR